MTSVPPRHQGPHQGIDIMADRNTPLVAVADAVVSRLSRVEDGLGGIYVWLRRADGVEYFYAHMESIATGLAEGSKVTAGQVIGAVGNTGDARYGATHCHFEIRPGGTPIDPYPHLVAVDPERAAAAAGRAGRGDPRRARPRAPGDRGGRRPRAGRGPRDPRGHRRRVVGALGRQGRRGPAARARPGPAAPGPGPRERAHRRGAGLHRSHPRSRGAARAAARPLPARWRRSSRPCAPASTSSTPGWPPSAGGSPRPRPTSRGGDWCSGRRLREIYVRDEPDPILVLLESGSIAAAIETTDLLQRITDRDGELAQAVEHRVDAVRRVARPDRGDAGRGVVVRAADRGGRRPRPRPRRASLETQQAGVRKLLSGRQALLAGVKGDRADIEAETEGLASGRRRSRDKIRAAQGLPPAPSGSVAVGAPSAAGLVWPVNGTITSGFGMRWGRMHEGIDIAGASGTPIAAAATGTVIVAGLERRLREPGGRRPRRRHLHGLRPHVEHRGLAWARAVGQGSVVGGMGTTGHSTGVHLPLRGARQRRGRGPAGLPLAVLGHHGSSRDAGKCGNPPVDARTRPGVASRPRA